MKLASNIEAPVDAQLGFLDTEMHAIKYMIVPQLRPSLTISGGEIAGPKLLNQPYSASWNEE